MRTLRLCVLTFIALTTGKVQAGCSVRWPSTSTTHMRQTPATSRSGWSHSVGMLIPAFLAASRMVTPNGTLASTPSMVTLTSAPMASGLVVVMTRRCCCESGARWIGVVGLLMLTPSLSSGARGAVCDLVAEALKDGEEGARAGLPEAALRSDLHGGAQRLDV